MVLRRSWRLLRFSGQKFKLSNHVAAVCPAPFVSFSSANKVELLKPGRNRLLNLKSKKRGSWRKALYFREKTSVPRDQPVAPDHAQIQGGNSLTAQNRKGPQAASAKNRRQG